MRRVFPTGPTSVRRPVAEAASRWGNAINRRRTDLSIVDEEFVVSSEGTSPSNIPVTAVTGTPAVLEASTDVATLVEVPTDAGAYIVTLVRGSTEEPWLAERIRPAGQ